VQSIDLRNLPEWNADLNQHQLEEGLRILARLIAKDIFEKSTFNRSTASPPEMPLDSKKEKRL
jgi:hypothetical protein